MSAKYSYIGRVTGIKFSTKKLHDEFSWLSLIGIHSVERKWKSAIEGPSPPDVIFSFPLSSINLCAFYSGLSPFHISCFKSRKGTQHYDTTYNIVYRLIIQEKRIKAYLIHECIIIIIVSDYNFFSSQWNIFSNRPPAKLTISRNLSI